MADVDVQAVQLIPQSGSDSKGRKLGLIDSAAKASQNDTLTVVNATNVQVLSCIDDTTGAFETHTVSDNVITLTSATTGAKTLMILYY